MIISIMQCFQSISITGGIPTNLPFLFMIVLISMFKDAYEDYIRYKRDEEENSRTVKVLDAKGVPHEKSWRDVAVGQIIRIERDKPFPADVILINSTE